MENEEQCTCLYCGLELESQKCENCGTINK